MQKYTTNTDALLKGSAFFAIFDNPTFARFNHHVDVVLRYYKVGAIMPNEWYLRQMFLDMFRKVARHVKNGQLVAVGMGLFDHLEKPTQRQPTAPLEALELLHATYHLNHRNLNAKSEGFLTEQVSALHLQVEDRTPWPHDLNYGLIYGLMRRCCRPGVNFFVERRLLNETVPDAAGALYDIYLDG